MRGGPGRPGTGAPSRGLTLPMRYLLRKRLKNPAPLEVTERRQVGDAEAVLNPPAPEPLQSFAARGSDSVL